MKSEFDLYIKKHDLKSCERLYMKMENGTQLTKAMIAFSVILQIARMEEDNWVKGLFWREDCKSMDELVELYYRIKYIFRRIEYDIEFHNNNEIVDLNISRFTLLMMISLFSINKKKVAIYINKCFSSARDKEMQQVLNDFISKQKAASGGT